MDGGAEGTYLFLLNDTGCDIISWQVDLRKLVNVFGMFLITKKLKLQNWARKTMNNRRILTIAF